MLTAPQSLEATLEEVVSPIPRVEAEDTFHGFAIRFVSEEDPALKIWAIPSLLSARPKDTVYEQRISIPGHSRECFIQLLDDDRRATKYSLETRVVLLIRPVLNQSFAKAF